MISKITDVFKEKLLTSVCIDLYLCYYKIMEISLFCSFIFLEMGKPLEEKILIVILIIWGLSLIHFFNMTPSRTHACSCAGPQNPEVALDQADAVFSGKVLEIKKDNPFGGYSKPNVLIEVTKTWKGVSESQVIIVTGQGGGDCGFDFVIGQKYLVYARHSVLYGDEENLTTGMCDRTSAIYKAGEDLELLGIGEEPSEVVNLQNDINSTGMLKYIWIILFILAGLTGLILLTTRKT